MSAINNMFLTVHRKTEGALTIVVFISSFTMLLIGINLFIEDTYTSYMGLQAYQATFDLTMNAWPITFWSESLLPQIGQIVLFYIFFSDTKKNWWALGLGFLFLLIDFYADIYYRTNGVLSINSDTNMRRTVAGAVVTLFYFTIGAELFISIGFGLALTTMAPAIKNLKKIINDNLTSLSSGGRPRSRPSQGRGRGRGSQSQPQRQPLPPRPAAPSPRPAAQQQSTPSMPASIEDILNQ